MSNDLNETDSPTGAEARRDVLIWTSTHEQMGTAVFARFDASGCPVGVDAVFRFRIFPDYFRPKRVRLAIYRDGPPPDFGGGDNDGGVADLGPLGNEVRGEVGMHFGSVRSAKWAAAEFLHLYGYRTEWGDPDAKRWTTDHYAWPADHDHEDKWIN